MRAPEDVLLQDLYSFNINKYAQYYVQYLKFKELVTVEPLMPDKKALEGIRQLEKAGEMNQAALEEQEAALEEEMNNIREEGNASDDPAQTEGRLEEVKERVEALRQQMRESEEGRMREVKTLSKRKRVSLDDERDYK